MLNRLDVVSPTLTPLLVPPLPRRLHVFTKDLEELVADLEACDDKAAVVRRYNGALFVKRQVRREVWSDLGPAALTYPKVCVRVRKAGRKRESRQSSNTCSGPRQAA